MQNMSSLWGHQVNSILAALEFIILLQTYLLPRVFHKNRSIFIDSVCHVDVPRVVKFLEGVVLLTEFGLNLTHYERTQKQSVASHFPVPPPIAAWWLYYFSCHFKNSAIRIHLFICERPWPSTRLHL